MSENPIIEKLIQQKYHFKIYNEVDIKQDLIMLENPKDKKKYLELHSIFIPEHKELISSIVETLDELLNSDKNNNLEFDEMKKKYDSIWNPDSEFYESYNFVNDLSSFNFPFIEEPIFDEFQNEIVCSQDSLFIILISLIDRRKHENELKIQELDNLEELVHSLLPQNVNTFIGKLQKDWKEVFKLDSLNPFSNSELLTSYFGFDCEHTQSNLRMRIEDSLLQMNKDDSIKYLKTILLLISRELEYFNTAMIEAQDKAKQYESIKHDHHDYYNFWHNALLKSSSAKNTISNLEKQKQYYEDKLNQFQPKEAPPIETLKQPESVLPENSQAATYEPERPKIHTKSYQPIIRIFEAMRESEIISLGTEPSQIAQLFFLSPSKEGNDFQNSYGKTKSNNQNIQSMTNSGDELIKFALTLCNHLKTKDLERLESKISELRNKRPDQK